MILKEIINGIESIIRGIGWISDNTYMTVMYMLGTMSFLCLFNWQNRVSIITIFLILIATFIWRRSRLWNIKKEFQIPEGSLFETENNYKGKKKK